MIISLAAGYFDAHVLLLELDETHNNNVFAPQHGRNDDATRPNNNGVDDGIQDACIILLSTSQPPPEEAGFILIFDDYEYDTNIV